MGLYLVSEHSINLINLEGIYLKLFLAAYYCGVSRRQPELIQSFELIYS